MKKILLTIFFLISHVPSYATDCSNNLKNLSKILRPLVETDDSHAPWDLRDKLRRNLNYFLDFVSMNYYDLFDNGKDNEFFMSYVYITDSDKKNMEYFLESIEKILEEYTIKPEVDFKGFFSLLEKYNLYHSYEITFELFSCLNDWHKEEFLLFSDHDKITSESFQDILDGKVSILEDSEEIQSHIDEIVTAEELLWWDTILEGDIILKGHAQPHDIRLYFYDDELWGYEIFIVADAETGDGHSGIISVTHVYDKNWERINTEDHAEFD